MNHVIQQVLFKLDNKRQGTPSTGCQPVAGLIQTKQPFTCQDKDRCFYLLTTDERANANTGKRVCIQVLTCVTTVGVRFEVYVA